MLQPCVWYGIQKEINLVTIVGWTGGLRFTMTHHLLDLRFMSTPDQPESQGLGGHHFHSNIDHF